MGISLKQNNFVHKIIFSTKMALFLSAILSLFLFIFPNYVNAEIISNDKFPPTLSSSLETSAPTDINTPEYVIIRPSEEATFSSETTASVATLNIKEGTIFHKGDVLLELDCRLQQADLQKAIAQQEATSKALESAKKLKTYGSISEFELVKTNSEAEAANADVSKLQVIVEKCVIKAPFNGAVAELIVHPHETVKPGDPLLKIVNTDNLTFEIQIPSAWLTWLHVGSVFSVRINDIQKTITAKVTLINPEIEPISQTVKINGVITPPDPELRPGMSGQANFPDNPIKKKV